MPQILNIINNMICTFLCFVEHEDKMRRLLKFLKWFWILISSKKSSEVKFFDFHLHGFLFFPDILNPIMKLQKWCQWAEELWLESTNKNAKQCSIKVSFKTKKYNSSSESTSDLTVGEVRCRGWVLLVKQSCTSNYYARCWEYLVTRWSMYVN